MADLIQLKINLIIEELNASIKTLTTKSDMTHDDILELKRLFYEVSEAHSYMTYRTQMGNIKYVLLLMDNVDSNSVSKAVHVIHVFTTTLDVLHKIMRIESLYDTLRRVSTARKLYTVLFSKATDFMQNINSNTVSFIKLKAHPKIHQELIAVINRVKSESQPYLAENLTHSPSPPVSVSVGVSPLVSSEYPRLRRSSRIAAQVINHTI